MNQLFKHTYNRRGMIRSMIAGSAILPGLLSQLLAEEKGPAVARDPLAPRASHFPARARRVIFLFMNGGVSHVDSWDPKPGFSAAPASPVRSMNGRGRKATTKWS